MSDGFVQRGGLWVLGQALLLTTIAIFGLVGKSGNPQGLPVAGSFVFFTIAVICGLFGLAALGRNLTPFPKPMKSARFVNHGIYRFIRHPLYVAVFCAGVGWSLFRESWPALLLCLVLGIFLDAKARHEEQWLCKQFSEYADYARRVKRFIPWIY